MHNTRSTTTHDRLLQEARDLFARRGYGGTSMSRIASQVGIQKASLYNYYDSKADLLMKLLEESLAAWSAACHRSLEGAGSVEARLAAYLGAAVEFSHTNPRAMALIRLAAAQVPGDLRVRVQSLVARYEASWRTEVTGLFREAIDRGELLSGDPKTLALYWSILLDGILINRVFATEKTESVVADLQALWRYFWRGISGNEPQTEISA
jgi:AcrR family transcriptional regulator